MKKYALINNETKEFYPDPIYTDLKRLKEKIDYLTEYRQKNNMDFVLYGIEILTLERKTQHNKEWKRWVSLID